MCTNYPFRRGKPRWFAYLSAIVFGFSMLLAANPAQAWKPHDHIYAANLAIASILAGSNSVEINGVSYAVDVRVADSIRNFPRYYRA